VGTAPYSETVSFNLNQHPEHSLSAVSIDDRKMDLSPPTRGVKRKVSFSEGVTMHEVPTLDPCRKRSMFYDKTDLRRFQIQERDRKDQEAADILLSSMAQGNSSFMVGSNSPFAV
jgi:hypothetical protein